MTTPTLLVGYYHGLLLSSIDADLLVDKMCSIKLLDNHEQAIISSGHSVYHRNWLLLEFVRHLDGHAVVVFCDLVQEIWPQVGSQLITGSHALYVYTDSYVWGLSSMQMTYSLYAYIHIMPIHIYT